MKQVSSVYQQRNPEPWELQGMILLHEQMTIPMDLLAGFLKMPYDRAAKYVEEWVELRWVRKYRFIVRDEPWIWLRQQGLDHVGKALGKEMPKSRKPDIWLLPHRRAVNALRLHLETEHPKGVWTSERDLWQMKEDEGYLPDGIFEVPKEGGGVERWAIEAELSRKSKPLYREILADRVPMFDQVRYFTTPTVARVLLSLPEVKKNPKIVVEVHFKDKRRVRQFQWDWSPHSGPNESPKYEKVDPWQVDLLRLIAEQGTIPIDQLARFLGCDEEQAQRIADHLDEIGLLAQGRGPTTDPPWVWLTKMGVRVAGTGLGYFMPSPPHVTKYRLLNHARLHAIERDPSVRWWSLRLLLRGAEDKHLPMAIVEDGQEQHAIEVEYRHKGSKVLREHYDNRCDEFPEGVVIFCSRNRVKTFEALKQEQGWQRLWVLEHKHLGRAPRRKRRVEPVIVQPVSIEDLPHEVLEKIRENERLPSIPLIKEVGRYAGRGARRWRVVTESGRVWFAVQSTFGLFVRHPKPDEEPRPEDEGRAPGLKRRVEPVRVRPVSIKDLPPEILEKIREKEGLQSTPRIKEVGRYVGQGAERWRVVTEAHVWFAIRNRLRVVVRHPKPDEEPRVTVTMVSIPPERLPKKAVKAIQKRLGLQSPPVIKEVKKYTGGGAPRWQVDTNYGKCRVTNDPVNGWLVRAPNKDEEVVPHEYRWPQDRPEDMEEADPWDVPIAALEAIQKKGVLSIPPRVIAAQKYRDEDGIIERFRLETDADTWRTELKPNGKWWAARSE